MKQIVVFIIVVMSLTVGRQALGHLEPNDYANFSEDYGLIVNWADTEPYEIQEAP